MILNCTIGQPSSLYISIRKNQPVITEICDLLPHILIERVMQLHKIYEFSKIIVDSRGDGIIVKDILAEKLGPVVLTKEV